MKRSVVVTSFCNNVTRIVMASALAELSKGEGLAKRKATTTTHLEHVLERKAPAWARKVERVLRREAERVAAKLTELLADKLIKGDLPGHEFRGNQWTSISAVKDNEEARLAMRDRLDDEVRGTKLSELQKDGYRMMRAAIGDTDTGVFVAEADGKLTAAISYNQKADGMHVLFFGSMQRGEGAKLIAKVEAQADKKGIPVRLTAVAGAVPFYKGRGYEPLGKVSGDDIGMVRHGIRKQAEADSEDVGALAYDPTRKPQLTKGDSAVSAEVRRILEELKLSDVSSQVVHEITPEMIAAFAKAGILGIGHVGIGYDQDITNHVDKKAIEYAAKRGAELVTKITEATRDEMRDLVERAVTEGMSAQGLAAEVRESRSFSKARSLMIGRTELAFAHVAGNLEGWRESGVVEGKQWQASINCCPICDLMDGMVVDLEDKFDFDGEQVDGPPGHPNCRCDVLPVLTDKGEQ